MTNAWMRRQAAISLVAASTLACSRPAVPPPSHAQPRHAAERIRSAADAPAQDGHGIQSPTSPGDPTPCRRIDLRHWGFERADEIRYASLGILHDRNEDRLVVYDLRASPPGPTGAGAPRSRPPDLEAGLFVVSHFDGAVRNNLGGFFNGFWKSPSTVHVSIDGEPDGSRALRVDYAQRDDGFAGVWVQLYDATPWPNPRVFLDARPLDYITFAVRGSTGAEDMTLKVADRSWSDKEDALEVGSVGSYLETGAITKHWQRAWVPMSDLPARIERRELANLVLQARGVHAGRVHVRDLAFTTSRTARIPRAPRWSTSEKPLRVAMWLWETMRVATDPAEISSLVEFCAARGITDIFLQIPYEASRHDERLRAGDRDVRGAFRIGWEPDELRPLLRALHTHGIRVDALDGDPRYALPENHGQVVAAIEAVAAYNARVAPDERFDGVRYDTEPYLLPGFGGRKETVLRSYLGFLRQAVAAANEAGLPFGADIPFWFDSRSDVAGWMAAVDGKPVSQHVIDIVDNLAIMDYRTSVYGPDGVVALGRDELDYAARAGKQVFIGLETVWLPDETVGEFTAGRGGEAGGERGSERGSERIAIRRIDEHRADVFRIPEERWPAFEKVVASWNDVAVLSRQNRVFVPSEKLTFQDLTVPELERVMTHTRLELSDVPSFIGFAIHSYESYRPWLEAHGVPSSDSTSSDQTPAARSR